MSNEFKRNARISSKAFRITDYAKNGVTIATT